mgnify:CR=1 FL=1
MNITVVKEELLKLYEKSLFLSEEYTYHPIRVIQAIKSIIGINIDKPIGGLLEFCKEYTDKYAFSEKVNYKNKDLDWLLNCNEGETSIDDISNTTSLIAIQ